MSKIRITIAIIFIVATGIDLVDQLISLSELSRYIGNPNFEDTDFLRFIYSMIIYSFAASITLLFPLLFLLKTKQLPFIVVSAIYVVFYILLRYNSTIGFEEYNIIYLVSGVLSLLFPIGLYLHKSGSKGLGLALFSLFVFSDILTVLSFAFDTFQRFGDFSEYKYFIIIGLSILSKVLLYYLFYTEYFGVLESKESY